MALGGIDRKIESLFEEWKSLQPLKSEYQETFDKKILLDLNYHSNKIEGNTLTYGETELLLIHGRHAGDHDRRDYLEMESHDVAFKKVIEYAKDKSRSLLESDIRDLNKILLKESFWKETITFEGQKTKKQIIPGKYKKEPNHVQTSAGEIFKFAKPEEVSAKMEELFKWHNKELQQQSLPIADFLAEQHHRFLLIHPFDDGNGRVARLWMNYTLLRLGYPPLIIDSEDRESYLTALQKADARDMNSLAVYLGRCLIKWLEIGIKAGKGEDIAEPSDVDKEVELFKRSKKGQIIYSQEKSEQFYKDYIEPFLTAFDKKFQIFDEMFESIFYELNPRSLWDYSNIEGSPKWSSFDILNKNLKQELQKGSVIGPRIFDRFKLSQRNDILKSHMNYKYTENNLNLDLKIKFQFCKLKYYIELSFGLPNSDPDCAYAIEKNYNQFLTAEERDAFLNKAKQTFLNRLQKLDNKS